MSYNKTALWLHTLERHLGWPVMQRILSTFFERWKFKHPQPADFFQIVNEVSGQDLTWFFDQVYRSSNTFDYGVQDLVSERRDDGTYRTTVIVRRYGEATFPVDVVTTFADGHQITEKWNGLDRRAIYVYERASRAAHVRGRSAARAAPRYRLHQQQPHARPAQRRGQPRVGGAVDGLAAGPDGHVCVLSLRAGSGVRSAPALLLGVYAMTLVLALPLAITMRGLLRTHLGASLAADARRERRELRLVAGVHVAGHRHRDDVLADDHRVRGHAGQHQQPARRPARDRAHRRSTRACIWSPGRSSSAASSIATRGSGQSAPRASSPHRGVHFFRLLRLAIVAGVVYWWLFVYVHRWLFFEWLADRTRTMAVERDVFLWRVALYAFFGLLLVVVNVIVRLRQDPHRRRGSPQCARCAVGGVAIRMAAARPGGGALRVERPGVPDPDRDMGARGSGRARWRADTLARLPRRAGLCARKAGAEAAVSRVGNRACSSRRWRTRRIPRRQSRPGRIRRQRSLFADVASERVVSGFSRTVSVRLLSLTE